MSTQPYGLIAMYETPAAVMKAAAEVSDAGYRFWDVISPCPIHGMDRVMGIRRSRVPCFSLVGGVVGFCSGMALVWWTSAMNYKLIVGGKPLFSPLYALPVAFELAILFAAFATLGGMFLMNRLPMHYHPVMKHPTFHRGTDDRFFIVIEVRDPRFNPSNTRALLEKSGGREIAELET
jgi:hypothetical protein